MKLYKHKYKDEGSLSAANAVLLCGSESFSQDKHEALFEKYDRTLRILANLLEVLDEKNLLDEFDMGHILLDDYEFQEEVD